MPHGRVTHADGSPVSGIAVAHGAEISLTDESGAYSVDGEGDHVVLSRPDGWKADPWFQSAETDPADFVLQPAPRTDSLCLAHVTDLHLSARPLDSYMEIPSRPGPVIDAIGQILDARPQVSLVVATGDLTDTGLDDEYAMLSDVFEAVPVEVLAVPGNHDHMAGEPRFFVNERGYGVNEGDPGTWEKHLGPRWFSLDRGGVHIVIVDWHMWELDVDRDVQERWVSADLALNAGKPWVLASHDQMPGEFFEPLTPPVATFSGHWHTSRTVRVGATIHVNTPPLTFAGLDHGRPAAVVAEWEGGKLALMRHEESLTGSAPTEITRSWSIDLGAKAGLAGPFALGDGVVGAVTWDDASGEGSVDAIDVSNGERLWRTRTDRAVKSTPAIAGDRIVLVDVASGITMLDADDGSVLWRTDPVAPLRTWCWTSPTVAGDLVVVATPTRVVAHRLDDGEAVWERTGLVPHANLVAHSSPLAVDDTVVVGFWPFSPAYFGLRVSDGEVLWSVDDPEGGPIDGSTGRGTALGPWSPVGPGAIGSDRAVFPAAGGWVALDPIGASFLWRSSDEGRFRPGRPLVIGERVIVVTPDRLKSLGLDSGETEWSIRFPDGGIALAPYRTTPHVGTGGANAIGDVLVVPGLDGYLYRRGVVSGDDLGRLGVGIRSAAAPMITEGHLTLLGVDGVLVAFPIDGVLA